MAAPAPAVLLVAIPLLLWSVYRRVRRFVGRQESKPQRHWLNVISFPLLVVLLALPALKSPLALEALAGGTLVGVAVALWGLKLTRFEKTAEGFFFTPSAHIGVVLSLIFVGRLAYSMFLNYSAAGGAPPPTAQNLAQSPLTLLTFGMLAGYYTAYAIGILHWRHAQQRGSASSP